MSKAYLQSVDLLLFMAFYFFIIGGEPEQNMYIGEGYGLTLEQFLQRLLNENDINVAIMTAQKW